MKEVSYVMSFRVIPNILYKVKIQERVLQAELFLICTGIVQLLIVNIIHEIS